MSKLSLMLSMILYTVIIFALSFSFYGLYHTITTADTEPETTVVLDYESSYYTIHCEAVADILATEGTNKMAKRKIKTYLKIAGAKVQ